MTGSPGVRAAIWLVVGLAWVCEIAAEGLAVQQIHWWVCLAVSPAAGTCGHYGMTGMQQAQWEGRAAAWLAVRLALGVFWMVVW